MVGGGEGVFLGPEAVDNGLFVVAVKILDYRRKIECTGFLLWGAVGEIIICGYGDQRVILNRYVCLVACLGKRHGIYGPCPGAVEGSGVEGVEDGEG